MAWQVSKRVWDHAAEIKESFKVMLLALADKADEHGVCWPKHDTSYETLGNMAGVNRRSAMRLIDTLCVKGHVIKVETVGRGHSNIYLVISGLSSEQVNQLKARIGVADNTINNEELVLQMTPKEVEMVLPVTQKGVTDDTNNGLNGVTGNTQSIMSPSNPSISPNGLGEINSPPELPGPRKQLMNEFLGCTGLKMPYRKSEERFWFSSIGELYELASKDVDVGKRLIREAVTKLRESKMTINKPESIIATARAILAEKTHKPKARATPK